MNRDEMRVMMASLPEGEEGPDAEQVESMGTPAALLTTRIDVRPWIGAKREAMRAHRSQIAEDSFFLAMPDEMFAQAFGTEWFVRVGTEPGGVENRGERSDGAFENRGERSDGAFENRGDGVYENDLFGSPTP